MAWIESHDDIWAHYKTRTLCRLLKISKVQAVGHLTSLWHFVLNNAWRDANLEAWGDDGIEEAARWDGKPGAFISAAREAGYLDGCTVHGWLDRAGELVKERFRNERRRGERINRDSTGDLPGIDRGPTTTTVPYRTVPYPTVPNPTQPKTDKAPDAPTKSAKKAFVQPTLAEVTAYCQERRNSVNPRKWFDHYTSNGWRVGRNPMKDWKAAVRTWEQSDISGASKTDDEFGRRGREITERIQREQREAGNA